MRSETGGPVRARATDPLDVYCTNCLASEGMSCTTIRGNQCSPHVARLRLAAAPGACGQCGAGHGQPCYKTSGGIRMYPHQSRMIALASQSERNR